VEPTQVPRQRSSFGGVGRTSRTKLLSRPNEQTDLDAVISPHHGHLNEFVFAQRHRTAALRDAVHGNA
jgi:hypothetical protein